jgi:hypothetical protein
VFPHPADRAHPRLNDGAILSRRHNSDRTLRLDLQPHPHEKHRLLVALNLSRKQRLLVALNPSRKHRLQFVVARSLCKSHQITLTLAM